MVEWKLLVIVTEIQFYFLAGGLYFLDRRHSLKYTRSGSVHMLHQVYAGPNRKDITERFFFR